MEPVQNKPILSEYERRELEIANERLGKFHRDRMGTTLDDLKRWFDELDKNPDAPCPKPKYIP